MDEKKLMQAIGIVGELQTNLLARYWNANEVFEGVSYVKAKEVYFKEMKALERLDRAIRYALGDDKQLTWDEYNNLVFHDNPCLLIRDIELCVTFTRLCEAGVAKRNHSLKKIVDTKIQSGASRSVSISLCEQSKRSVLRCERGASKVASEESCGENEAQVREWALEMLGKIEERRVAKMQSKEV